MKLVRVEATGMNNRSNEYALPKSKVQNAVNVQFDNENNVIFPRQGFTRQYLGTNTHSLFNSPVMTLFVENGDLKQWVNGQAITITAGIGNTAVSYCVVGDTCYWCNGTQTGKVRDGIASEWGVARPPRQPDAVGTDYGGMYAGDYRVAITWIGSDGTESGTGMGKRVTVNEGGGIYLSNFPTPPSYVQAVAVYVSSVNGKDMYLYDEYRPNVADIHLSHKIGDIALQTQFGFPPAPIDKVSAHYGRIYYPRKDRLYYTATRRYGLQIANSYLRFDSEIQTLNSIPGYLFVGTKNRIYSVGNIDGDGAANIEVLKYYGTVKGSECDDDESHISYVMTKNGFVRFSQPSAQMQMVTELSYADVAIPHYTSGSMTVIEQHGLKYLVGVFKGGSPNKLAI